MPSTNFERWEPHNEQTLCYAHFKKNEAAINEYFWHSAGIFNDASVRAAGASALQHINTIFDYGSDLGNRNNTIIKDFNDLHIGNTNLFRLLSLIACASYFEHYLNQAFKMSLYSNPGVLFGHPKALDGTKILKTGEVFAFQSVMKDMVQGKWASRYKKIKNVFKVEINTIKTNIEKLEKERLRRNMIAHQFGLDGDTRFIDRIDLSFFEQTKILVTDDEVRENFTLIRSIVDEVEEKISATNIGSFELILFVHYYKANVDQFREKMPARYKNLELKKLISKFSQDNGAQNVKRKKAEDIINYYDRL